MIVVQAGGFGSTPQNPGLKKKKKKAGVVAHACTPSTGEAVTIRFPGIAGQKD